MIHIVGDINFSDGFFDTGFGIGRQIKKGLNFNLPIQLNIIIQKVRIIYKQSKRI